MPKLAGMPIRWTVADSIETYMVRSWGGQYFDVNSSGHCAVRPSGGPESIDLKELVDEVRKRGIGLPLLVRFPEILRGRITELNEAFRRALAEYGYKAAYKG